MLDATQLGVFEVRHAEPHFCVARYLSMVVVVWGRITEVVDLHALSKVQREAVAAHDHCVVLTIIRAGKQTTVKDGVREASRDNVQEFEATGRGAALIVEGGGFRMVFFRTVLTGVQLLARSAAKQKVFDNIDEGVRWLVTLPGIEPRLLAQVEAIITGAHACADTYGLPP